MYMNCECAQLPAPPAKSPCALCVATCDAVLRLFAPCLSTLLSWPQAMRRQQFCDIFSETFLEHKLRSSGIEFDYSRYDTQGSPPTFYKANAPSVYVAFTPEGSNYAETPNNSKHTLQDTLANADVTKLFNSNGGTSMYGLESLRDYGKKGRSKSSYKLLDLAQVSRSVF